MFGKDSHLTSVASRKQLLIAESELNRLQLAADMALLKVELNALNERARAFRVIGSALGALLTELAARQRGGAVNDAPKLRWLQTLSKGAGLISDVWLACRPKKDGGIR